MPTPDHGAIDRLSRRLLDVYTAAEKRLYQRIALHISAGITANDWEERQISELNKFREELEQTTKQLQVATAAQVPALIRQLAVIAQKTDESDLLLVRDGPYSPTPVGGRIFAGAAAANDALEPIPQRMRFVALSVYRSVVDVALALEQAQGPTTRLRATQRALNSFARKGITGFVDRSGRNWDMSTYVEMSMRTVMANTAISIQNDRLRSLGFDLVIVSNAPQECEICRPYEGKILSLSGNNVGNVSVPNPVTDVTVKVQVFASLDQARSDGLYHPNCRHSQSAYLPGITERPKNTEDVEGDQARQQLRYLERKKREWLRVQEVALTDEQRKRARKSVDYYTSRIKSHVDTTPAKRQPRREQITSAR